MWSAKKILGVGIGVGAGLISLKKCAISGAAEAGEKPPFPPQSHCIGAECPRTRWDDDWDKKKGVKSIRRGVYILTHGQPGSGGGKNPKLQQVSKKGQSIEVKKLPSDPKRLLQPKRVANTDDICEDARSQDGGDKNSTTQGGSLEKSDDGSGLSPTGESQIKAFMQFFAEEYGYMFDLNYLIHGTDPASTATARMLENGMQKARRGFKNVETSMLDALKPGQDDLGGDLARLEAVFRKYFHRMADDADYRDMSDYDLIVCSPQIAGYFVCRLLQIPPDRFSNWQIPHGSFTECLITEKGLIVVQRVGDAGYLPPNLVTYS